MLNVYKKILHYVPKERWLAFFAIFLTVVSSVLTVLAYYYINELLKGLIVLNETKQALSFALVIVGLLIISSLIYLCAVLLTHILGFRLETNLRKRGIDGLMNSSFKFFDLNSSGRTRQLIDDNAAQTHNIVAHLIPDNAGAILTPILVIAVGFVVDIKVGAALVVFSLIGFVQLARMTGDKKFMSVYQSALERMNSETVEYVRGIQVVKIFDADINSFKALHKSIMDYSRYALDYSMSSREAYVIFQVIFLGAVAVAVPIILFFMDIHANPLGLATNLIMLLFLSGVLFTGFMKVMYVAMYAFLGVSSVEKLESIFTDMQEDRLSFGRVNEIKGYDIEFDKVSFAYGDAPVLENLSFKLQSNRSYALVGASGSGKSTIAKLISGFYRLNGGSIKIGGRDLTEYSEEAIIKNIAFVFQDSKLFKTSIFENVQAGNPAATREQVFDAMSQAGCNELIKKFPQGEHTVIGSKGVFLSGGEKQRIAIARAILKDAGIIIMDEASAAIDPENEHELQKAFKNLIRGKTVIMIAHRLSSIKAVDEILVMEKGKIVERGSDAELMNRDGRYKYFQELYAQANEWRVGNEEAI